MLDIVFSENDFQFILRTSVIIFNKEMDKVLLFRVNDKDFFMLVGGKISRLETSLAAIKRELKEEIDIEIEQLDFVGISEEFVNAKGFNNHQINIIYKGIYNGEVNSSVLIGLEGDWCHYEWIEVKDINNYDIYPHIVKEFIKSPNQKFHYVDNMLKKS